jgi:hypothetical protein
MVILKKLPELESSIRLRYLRTFRTIMQYIFRNYLHFLSSYGTVTSA